MIARPEYLPDYASPPLDEVVIGVQFAPPLNYSSVLSKDVWELFKKDYPNVQELPPLDPMFETFGGSNSQPSMRFQFGTAPLHNRLWFVSSEQNRLIQFQQDRFLLNWRRRPKGDEYPRFECIAESFETALASLRDFFSTSLGMRLDINQAEVSYINVIPVESYSRIGDWLRFLRMENIDLEAATLNFTEVVNNQDGRPYARLFHELQSVASVDGKVKAYSLTFTFRGTPAGGEIAEAMNFVHHGRERIVSRFGELASDNANVLWERKK